VHGYGADGVQLETGTLEFRNPTLERAVGLTPADRKWMDEVVQDVNETWDEGGASLQFKGSDDYLRQKVRTTWRFVRGG
jgi:hypothetical protein